MAWDSIPRTHSFSLGDFHDFNRCVFRFFVNHHLQKKYELAEGSPGQAIGCLLDLAIKKFHTVKAYHQPVDYLVNLIKAAQVEMKNDALKKGKNSFYGAQVEFLTPETVQKAAEVFRKYYLGKKGKIKKMVPAKTLQGSKPFWQLVIGQDKLKLWGGPDSIETGEDGVPEIVDYKYLEKGDESTNYLDMDLMPKLYTLLCASELQNLGYQKARFVVRLWHDPGNDSFYEEFALSDMPNLEAFFIMEIGRILRTDELSFCGKDYCKVCSHPNKPAWIKALQQQGWIQKSPIITSETPDVSDLPF